MSLPWAVVAVFGSAAIAIALLLQLRRRAPVDGYFNDGDRAAGVFGVLATGFAILVGFVVFLAFTSYDESRAGAETEALMVLQQAETAQLLSEESADQLTGQLICYGRTVVHQEWPRMEAGEEELGVNPWGAALFTSIAVAQLESPAHEAAYGKWLDQTSVREEARLDRLHGAEGIIPTPLWVALFLAAAVIGVFMLFFADSGERAVVQALLIGSVTMVMATLLVLLAFLDDPFGSDLGAIPPTAMERTLETIDDALAVVGREVPVPCTATGEALGA